MIPSHWLGYRRIDDNELLGYVVPTDGALFTPVTVFGYPLTPAGAATTQSGDWTRWAWTTWPIGGYSKLPISLRDQRRDR